MSLSTRHLERCIQTLELSLQKINECDSDSIEYELYRNSTIKGYELTLETAGKLLRKALKPYFATSKEVDRLTFKDVFRNGFKHSFIEEGEIDRWMEYRDSRNSTAHDYGEAFAESVLPLLPKFVADAKALLGRIPNE